MNLRELERRGCSIRRTHGGVLRHRELIRVTERKAHCGGCGNDHPLSNPGCGVGHDKARREY